MPLDSEEFRGDLKEEKGEGSRKTHPKSIFQKEKGGKSALRRQKRGRGIASKSMRKIVERGKKKKKRTGVLQAGTFAGQQGKASSNSRGRGTSIDNCANGREE